MIDGIVALIGLGAIGSPIADKLYKTYSDKFVLVASGERRKKIENQKITINGTPFEPKIISNKNEINEPIKLLIVCIKNYSLEDSLDDINNIVSEDTIILPLQNGISSYEFFRKNFPNNIVLHGYVQGPNTKVNESEISYTNSGVMHIGDTVSELLNKVADVYAYVGVSGLEVHLEQNIQKMVWKKWMLNVAGNSITALTNADYSDFKKHEDLQIICRQAMKEFSIVAMKEGIILDDNDIQDVLNYYINYNGRKSTSMLEDIRCHRKTENDFLAGKILEISEKHQIELPTIKTLFYLIKIKEALYLRDNEE